MYRLHMGGIRTHCAILESFLYLSLSSLPALASSNTFLVCVVFDENFFVLFLPNRIPRAPVIIKNKERKIHLFT